MLIYKVAPIPPSGLGKASPAKKKSDSTQSGECHYKIPCKYILRISVYFFIQFFLQRTHGSVPFFSSPQLCEVISILQGSVKPNPKRTILRYSYYFPNHYLNHRHSFCSAFPKLRCHLTGFIFDLMLISCCEELGKKTPPPTWPRKCFLLTELLLYSLMRKLTPCSFWLTGKIIVSPHFTRLLEDFSRRVFFLSTSSPALNIAAFTKKPIAEDRHKLSILSTNEAL